MTHKESLTFIDYALNILIGESKEGHSLSQNSKAKKAMKMAAGGDFTKVEQNHLNPIFENILKNSKSSDYAYEDLELSIDLNFPKQNDAKNESVTDLNKALADCETTKDALRLLQFKGSYRPCNLKGSENVSLYHFVRIALAIYQCLLETENENKPLLMIGADVSGVQSYLYDIISTHASKNLKGRSFYIQLLTENILQRLLGDIGLKNHEHLLIYNSGGGFYLLAPNRSNEKEALKRFRIEIQKKLYDEHGGDLYVAMDFVEVTESALNSGKDLSGLWRKLSEKLSLQKRQRFDFVIKQDFSKIFEPTEVSSAKQDAITGELIEEGVPTKAIKTGSAENQRDVLLKNYAQIELAKELNKAQSWSLNDKESSTEYSFNRPDVGIYNVFQSNKNGDRVFNQFGIEKDTFLISGNYYPTDEDGSPKTFDSLPKQGFNKLGVLRMDVDGLGQVFIRGFEHQRASLAKYAELSSKLDLFFKGYINTMHAKTDARKNSTYIIYSAGDDLFIVGDWNELIEFAFDIESEFKKWTCNNPMLSISGGMAVVNKSYPIMKAAELAGEAEEQAKDFINPATQKPKNAFSLFEIPFSWEEKAIVLKWKEQWTNWLNEKQVSKSLLFSFLQYRNMKEDTTRPDLQLKWQWMAAYRLARSRKDKRMSKEAHEALQQLVVNGQHNYRALDLASVGAKWAELKER
jgi:CRISPR-associated protein Csm1